MRTATARCDVMNRIYRYFWCLNHYNFMPWGKRLIWCWHRSAWKEVANKEGSSND